MPLFAGVEPKVFGEGGFTEQAADAWAVCCGTVEDKITAVVGVGLDEIRSHTVDGAWVGCEIDGVPDIENGANVSGGFPRSASAGAAGGRVAG